MLEAAGFKVTVGGNIGAPLSAQVRDSTPDTFHVVEASSFQLEQIDTFHPWIAVVLNFSPDHLDRHPSVEAYAAAKARIFANQDAGDFAVINADDPAVLALARRGRASRRPFARSQVLRRRRHHVASLHQPGPAAPPGLRSNHRIERASGPPGPVGPRGRPRGSHRQQ
jgi:UDP-N-acetylmuramoylalanine--D-glutamate ligase